MARRLLRGLALLARRRYGVIFFITGIVLGLSVLAISRLRFDTDILNLLPQRSPEVQTLRAALDQFGSLDYLVLVVRVPPDAVLEPYEAFADTLGARLMQLDLLNQVDYKIGEMGEIVRAFLPQSLLFLGEQEQRAVEEKLSDAAVRGRVQELRRLVETPQAFALKELMRLDPLGLSEIFLKRVTSSRAGLAVDWTSGYLLSRDHQMLLLLAKPVEAPQNVEFARQLVQVVEREIEAVRSEWPDLVGSTEIPAPEVAIGGRYVIALGDDALIRRDVLVNILGSMAGVLTLFLFAFRRIGLLLYAVVPLSCGLALTFGFAGLAYGQLSVATSGVAALLIGLGIDFVIVSYGRFVEERQKGASLEDALVQMNGSSGRAVVVGAVTSAATFYAFGVTEFTGLLQMGLLTGTGILFCMVAVLWLLPAMLAWSEDHHERRERRTRLFLHGFGSAHLVRFSLNRPYLMLLLGGLVTAATGFLALQVKFVDSVQAMRPAGNPGAAVREEVAERFGIGFDQMMLVVGGETLEEVLSLAEQGARGAEEMVATGVLTGYDAVTSLIPPIQLQRRNLEWLEQQRSGNLDMSRIRATFEQQALTEGLRSVAFQDGLDLLEQAVSRNQLVGVDDFKGVGQTSNLLDRYLAQTETGWNAVVYLYPPAKIWRREAPPQVHQLADSLGPQVVLTGANVVSGFLRSRVLRDAVEAAILGFVIVAMLLWLDYRRTRDTILTLVPLCVGIVWMLGGMVALGENMNFMNIFVTTMIIGIGVDYGIHMTHRYRELGGQSEDEIRQGLVETGKAIVLAALSTVVGFGSLSLSHYPGLRSMGKVAILGAVSTAVVAITLLPAYLELRRRGSAGR